MTHARSHAAGLTLVDIVVSVSVFTMVALAIFSIIQANLRAIGTYREKSEVAALADRYIEVVRNLPYSQVGTVNGNPHGVLPDQPNALQITYNNASYKVYYAVSYVDDPADGTILAGTDPAPNDYKQIKVYIQKVATGATTPFLTNVSPKGLEGLASGGALSIQVFDSVGQPVPNATLTIANNAISPTINLTRTADTSGNWIEVGLPNSVNGYHITATKSGYSSDQTYPISGGNPNPVKPDATISNGQVTQISFSIDKQSDLTINGLDSLCQPLNGIGVALTGTKLIGTSPNVLKFDSIFSTNSSGQIELDPIEWDTYTPSITSSGYMIYGSSPIQQITVFPDTSLQSTMILGPATTNSLLVIVKDATTGNPLEGATVQLSNAGIGYDVTKYTAGSTLYQEDWSGGSGSSDFSPVTASQYLSDDGNVDVTTLPTGVRIKKVLGSYLSSGMLISSTFDTGTASSSYTTLSWSPPSQSASTSLTFQLAANNDKTTWNFTGPDGTDASYYTTPGQTIPASLNSNRYLRYKAFLATASTSTTPVLSNVSVNYVSGCFSPGQSMFAGLQSDNNYTIQVSMTGYATQTISNAHISGYNVLQVLLAQ